MTTAEILSAYTVDVAERVEAVEQLPEAERQPAREAWIKALGDALVALDERREELRRESGWPKQPGVRARPARRKAAAQLEAADNQRHALAAIMRAVGRRSRPGAIGSRYRGE